MIPLTKVLFNFITNNIGLDIVLICGLILAIVLLGIYLVNDYAFQEVSTAKLKSEDNGEKKGIKKAIFLAEKEDITMISFFVLELFSVLLIAALTTVIAFAIFDNIYLALLVVFFFIAFVLSLVFAVSYKLGREYSEKKILKYSNFIWFMTRLTLPLTLFLHFLTKKIKNKEEVAPEDGEVTDEEIEEIIDDIEDTGIFDEDDVELIQSALVLSVKTVYDIMTPRVDMVALDEDLSNQEALDVFFEYQYSRIPVYKGDKDTIVGVLSERDFFTAIIKKGIDNFKFKDLVTEPYYVSKNTKVDDLITEFQEAQRHFAIVLDEYGGTFGIVTMEDALEELVGEIYDEYDVVEDDEYLQLSKNKYLLDQGLDLQELFDELKLGIIPNQRYNTVGGFVFSLCNGLPQVNQKVVHIQNVEDYEGEKPMLITYELKFKVLEVVDRRIKKVEMIVDKLNEEPLI